MTDDDIKDLKKDLLQLFMKYNVSIGFTCADCSEIRTNVDLIMNKGAHLVDVTHNIDTSTPSGKLLIPIFSMLAEIDQVLRTERTVAGWEVAKREGRTGGRKPGLNDLAKKKAEQAKKMYLSKDPFYSAKEIASILNISTRTLYKYLRSVGVEPKQNQ